jgi:hypothetical protein
MVAPSLPTVWSRAHPDSGVNFAARTSGIARGLTPATD